jgi:hypothetical protein
MYTDEEAVNGVVKQDMERLFRKASQVHRLKHLGSEETRMLTAIWTALPAFLRRALDSHRPAIVSARERLSY